MKQVDANVFLIWSVLVSIGSSSCQPSSDSQIPSNTKYKFYISHEYRHQTYNITSDQVVKVEVTDTQQAPICRIDNGQGMVLKWSDGDSSKIRAPDCRNKTTSTNSSSELDKKINRGLQGLKFTCRADRCDGEVIPRITITFEVEYPPKPKLVYEPAKFPCGASFTCNADAKPAANTFSWYLNNQDVPGVHTKHWYFQGNKSGMNTVKCRARNIVAVAEVELKFNLDCDFTLWTIVLINVTCLLFLIIIYVSGVYCRKKCLSRSHEKLASKEVHECIPLNNCAVRQLNNPPALSKKVRNTVLEMTRRDDENVQPAAAAASSFGYVTSELQSCRNRVM